MSRCWQRDNARSARFPPAPNMTARKMVRDVKRVTKDWEYGLVSIGYPGPVIHGRPLHEPHNLGGGWVGFNFRKAFGCPVEVINDAAMQALGSYHGGRMLFLGLGAGLGSAMIVDGILEPMELAHLAYKNGKTYEDYVGVRGLKRLGKKNWRRHVADVVERLKDALEAEYVVLGGGNAKNIGKLPPDTRLGDNRNAFVGGFRLWKKKTKPRASGHEEKCPCQERSCLMAASRSDALVLFGVTGDLAHKMIFPALYAMVKRGTLKVPVIGVALPKWSLERLHKRVTDSIKRSGGIDNRRALHHLLSLFKYVSGDYKDPNTFTAIKSALGGARRPAHYLAIPPPLFETVIKGLGAANLARACARHCRKAIRT